MRNELAGKSDREVQGSEGKLRTQNLQLRTGPHDLGSSPNTPKWAIAKNAVQVY